LDKTLSTEIIRPLLYVETILMESGLDINKSLFCSQRHHWHWGEKKRKGEKKKGERRRTRRDKQELNPVAGSADKHSVTVHPQATYVYFIYETYK
jgi:hypothetical protein